jgi:hypothetical protein
MITDNDILSCARIITDNDILSCARMITDNDKTRRNIVSTVRHIKVLLYFTNTDIIML